MTRFLIDTHCFLWLAWKTPDVLRPSAASLLRDPTSDLMLSSVSAAEISIKWRTGKLNLPDMAERFVTSQMEQMRLSALPLSMTHALRLASLPKLHRDPFDLLLVAQCQAERLPLMTADRQLAAYDIDIIWAGRGDAPPGARA